MLSFQPSIPREWELRWVLRVTCCERSRAFPAQPSSELEQGIELLFFFFFNMKSNLLETPGPSSGTGMGQECLGVGCGIAVPVAPDQVLHQCVQDLPRIPGCTKDLFSLLWCA